MSQYFYQDRNVFNPRMLSNLQVWYDVNDGSTITSALQTLTPTVSGTSGTTTLTASGDLSGLVFAGMTIRVNSADTYTVASISTSVGISTITTSTTLVNSYTTKTLETYKVSQINDKSGNGNNATQGTAASQPIYSPNQINNKASLVYADAQNMSIPHISGMETGFTTFHVLIADQDNSANTFGNCFDINGVTALTSQRQPLIYFHKSTTKYNFSVGTFDAMQFNPSNNVATQSYCTYDGATTATSKVSGFTLVSTAITQLTSGASVGGLGTSTMRGSISEIIVYKRLLTSAEIAQVQNYLLNKWGTAV